MIDPNNVLIRCPNGHELQALKADLAKPLECPICNVTFTPSAPSPSSAPPTIEGMAPTGPTSMGYASSLTERIEYPQFTSWMLGAWILATVITAISTTYSAISHGGAAPQPSNAMGTMLLGCVSGMITIAAIVLHLMWIFRIHKDAKRRGDYEGVSPGLALGLSFLPAFNYVWTGWTMKKLASFVNDRESAPSAQEAVDAAKLCLIAGIIMASSLCILLAMAFGTSFAEVWDMMSNGVQPGSPEWQQRLQGVSQQPIVVTIIHQIVQVAGVMVYFLAVRKLEASLYPFLGAPPR